MKKNQLNKYEYEYNIYNTGEYYGLYVIRFAIYYSIIIYSIKCI